MPPWHSERQYGKLAERIERFSGHRTVIQLFCVAGTAKVRLPWCHEIRALFLLETTGSGLKCHGQTLSDLPVIALAVSFSGFGRIRPTLATCTSVVSCRTNFSLQVRNRHVPSLCCVSQIRWTCGDSYANQRSGPPSSTLLADIIFSNHHHDLWKLFNVHPNHSSLHAHYA